MCTRERPGEVSSTDFHEPWRALKPSDSEEGSKDLDPVTASEVPDARSSSSLTRQHVSKGTIRTI